MSAQLCSVEKKQSKATEGLRSLPMNTLCITFGGCQPCFCYSLQHGRCGINPSLYKVACLAAINTHASSLLTLGVSFNPSRLMSSPMPFRRSVTESLNCSELTKGSGRSIASSLAAELGTDSEQSPAKLMRWQNCRIISLCAHDLEAGSVASKF